MTSSGTLESHGSESDPCLSLWKSSKEFGFGCDIRTTVDCCRKQTHNVELVPGAQPPQLACRSLLMPLGLKCPLQSLIPKDKSLSFCVCFCGLSPKHSVSGTLTHAVDSRESLYSLIQHS